MAFPIGTRFSEEHKRKIGEKSKGRKLSLESRRKISESKKGRPGTPHTEEFKLKMSQKMKGNTYGKGKKKSKEAREKLSKSLKGRPHTEEHKKKLSDAKKGKPSTFKGKHQPESQKIQQSIRMKQYWIDHPDWKPAKDHIFTKEEKEQRSIRVRREKHPRWKGGITSVYQLIRGSIKMTEWRNAVFKKDNYCDWFSGLMGSGNLVAHHIVPLKEIIKRNHITTIEEANVCAELWDVNNGITMFVSSHIAYHQMFGK